MTPFTFRFSDTPAESWLPHEASELRDFQVEATWTKARHIPLFKHGTSHFTISARMIGASGREQLVTDRFEVSSHVNGFCSRQHYRAGIERTLLLGLRPRWGRKWVDCIEQQLKRI